MPFVTGWPPFPPEYRARNNRIYDKSPDLPVLRKTIVNMVNAEDRNIRFPSNLKPYVSFSAFMSFLGRWDLLQRFGTTLDLGGGDGMFAGLLKAAGVSAHASNVDMLDFTSFIDTQYRRDFIAYVGGLHDGSIELDEKAAVHLQLAKNHYDLFPKEPMTGLWNAFPLDPEVDRNIHDDLFNVAGQYDLVTSICVVDLYDPNKTLAKIRSLLKPGGLAVLLEEHYWWPVNSCSLVGHFPYAMQRLSYADLKRYVSEHHPELVESLDQRYNYLYAANPPSGSSWIDLGTAHGLKIEAVERVMPKRHHRAKDTPPSMLRQPWFKPEEVLRDIHARRPDVTLEDLMTNIMCLAFRAV